MTVKLSRRLAAVARHVPPGTVVADIGADHALLPLHLVGGEIASRVVAVEAGCGPYDIAVAAVRRSGLEKSIEVRLGDGLQVLVPGEAGVVVLAGMGGETICRILAAGRPVLEQLDRLIVQPMRDVPLVRRWLADNGWRLREEEVVQEEGHYYIIMVAGPGREKIDDVLLELGPRLLEKRDPVLFNFLQHRRNQITAVLEGLGKARGNMAGKKAGRLKKEAEKIREVLENWP